MQIHAVPDPSPLGSDPATGQLASSANGGLASGGLSSGGLPVEVLLVQMVMAALVIGMLSYLTWLGLRFEAEPDGSGGEGGPGGGSWAPPRGPRVGPARRRGAPRLPCAVTRRSARSGSGLRERSRTAHSGAIHDLRGAAGRRPARDSHGAVSSLEEHPRARGRGARWMPPRGRASSWPGPQAPPASR